MQFAYGATLSGSTKTVNIATGGVSGSTTTVNFGSSVSGATTTVGAYGTWTFNTAIGVASGGTGLTSFTSNGIVYANSTSSLTTGSGLTFDGTTFKVNSGTTNATTYNTAALTGGSLLTVQQQKTTLVSVLATTILTPGLYGSFLLVFGTDGTNRFMDVILFGLATGTVNVISSLAVGGTPASRTYTQASSTWKLAMASGIYTVQAAALSMSD